MGAPRYFMALAHERFPPDELLAQARAAEAAGFDGVCCSDHLQPWWEPGESGNAWVWLGAAAAATERAALGSAVTAPMFRYHPVVVAQCAATLEALAPGRAFLGLGSGEALNESPTGADWPPAAEQLARLDEAVELIARLLDGERVTFEGRHFRTRRAVLHSRPARRPPVYVSAFHPGAAAVAGRRAEGVWCIADPEMAGTVVDAYRSAAEDAGRPPGEVLLQLSASWAATDEEALEGSREWKATMPPEFFVDDWYDPVAMQEHARRQVSDEEFLEANAISSDPEHHVERLRAAERLGATTVVVMNISGSDPMGTIRTYGERVLPALRAGRSAAAR